MEPYRLRQAYPIVGSLIALSLYYFYFNLTFLFMTGFIVSMTGLILWWVATIQLGSSFALMPHAKKLVTTGIYGKLRHPIYLGMSIFTVGLALLSLNVVVTLLCVSIVVSSAIRALLEEKKLQEAFGDEYTHYKKRTWL